MRPYVMRAGRGHAAVVSWTIRFASTVAFDANPAKQPFAARTMDSHSLSFAKASQRSRAQRHVLSATVKG